MNAKYNPENFQAGAYEMNGGVFGKIEPAIRVKAINNQRVSVGYVRMNFEQHKAFEAMETNEHMINVDEYSEWLKVNNLKVEQEAK
jgi:hypothetical protein